LYTLAIHIFQLKYLVAPPPHLHIWTSKDEYTGDGQDADQISNPSRYHLYVHPEKVQQINDHFNFGTDQTGDVIAAVVDCT